MTSNLEKMDKCIIFCTTIGKKESKFYFIVEKPSVDM